MPFKDKVYRLAKRLLVSNDEAESATQELYMKLWNRRKQLEIYNSVEALAMTMTKNYCLDRLKSKQAGNLTLVHSNFSSNGTDVYKITEIHDSITYGTQIDNAFAGTTTHNHSIKRYRTI